MTSTAGKTKHAKTRDASPILAGKGVSSSGPGRTSAQATSNAARTSLGAGIAKPVGARIDWARLIQHIYLDDVWACPCGARRRVLAHIDPPDVIAAILEHLGKGSTLRTICRQAGITRDDFLKARYAGTTNALWSAIPLASGE